VTERIGVIKLGALGDFLQASGPFAAIRRHHGEAEITLLTTAPFVEFALESPWFDQVWTDPRPRAWQAGAWLALRARLRGAGFTRVYDLQTSDRSGRYFRILGPGERPEWSGIAKGCSHPHANPRRDFMHTLERQAEQLEMAGIGEVGPADLSWVRVDPDAFGLGAPYALLVPGGAAHRPEKRWPGARFAALAGRLADGGVEPVLLGTEAEKPLVSSIAEAEPRARNLCGQTSLSQLVGLARAARLALGNDTGPMHAFALGDCPSVVLFSRASDPALCAPRGRRVHILVEDDLETLGVDAVWEVAQEATREAAP
jgi:ADP-heptose:LPS heptosyltransferase